MRPSSFAVAFFAVACFVGGAACSGCGAHHDLNGNAQGVKVVRDDPGAAGSSDERDAALARIEAALAASDLEDVTLALGKGDKPIVVLSKGDGGRDRSYHADSAQKWILATLLLRDARARGVTLEQPMSSWPQAPSWAAGDVGATTLRDLLSFTAGFEDPPPCAQMPAGKSFRECIPKLVSSTLVTPRRFFYGTHHMMIALAGLSAGDAGDVSGALLQRFKDETGLLKTTSHRGDKPLALTTTAGEYAGFLQALSQHRLLTPDDEAAMFKDQVGDRAIAMSPADRAVKKGTTTGRWRYGLGNWVECNVGQPCSQHHHSAGARGFYPWLDLDDGSFGVVAHNARVGDWTIAHALYLTIHDDIRIVVGG